MATGRESDGSDMPRRKVFPTFTPRVQCSNPCTVLHEPHTHILYVMLTCWMHK